MDMFYHIVRSGTGDSLNGFLFGRGPVKYRAALVARDPSGRRQLIGGTNAYWGSDILKQWQEQGFTNFNLVKVQAVRISDWAAHEVYAEALQVQRERFFQFGRLF
jgi:hypothetical protein